MSYAEKKAEALEAAAAFAREVAANMPFTNEKEEGEEKPSLWTGGAEDNGRDGWLQAEAFITKGRLRVEWVPVTDSVSYHDGEKDRKFHVPERLTMRGVRERVGNFETGFYRDNPKITAATKRGAKAIAGEITRRLLPGYTEAMVKADEEQARHDGARGDLAATVETVRAAMPEVNLTDGAAWMEKDSDEHKELRLYHRLKCGDSISADLRVSPGSVTVELKAYTMAEANFESFLGALSRAIGELSEETV